MQRIKIIIMTFFFISGSFFFSSEAFPALNLSSGLNDLTEQIISSMAQKNKSKLAIMDFVNLDGSVNNFCRYLSEHLITKIYLTNKFDVIERRLLSKVLEEAKLSMWGIIDEKTAQKLGNILGIDSICAGSVSNLGKIVEVNARLFETNTGKIFAVASTQFQKDEMVASLMNQVSKKLRKQSKAIEKTPKLVEGIEVEIPEGFDYAVVTGDGNVIPIKNMRHKHEGTFEFIPQGAGLISAQFKKFRVIKFFGKSKHDKYKTVVEVIGKDGKRYKGVVRNLSFSGLSELGRWSAWPFDLKALYIK